MKKILRKSGSCLAILFNSEDRKTYDMSYGDVFDVELAKVGKIKLEKKTNKKAVENDESKDN